LIRYVFVLAQHGEKQAMKHTITKKGDDAFLSSFEVDGKRAFTEACTRLGP